MKRALSGLAAATVLAVCSPGLANAGTGWTIQPVPSPSNAKHASLAAVGCWSTTGCIAVGNFCYRNHCVRTHALAEERSGSSWTVQHLAKPGPSWNSALSGISCVSTRSCTAVGTGLGSDGSRSAIAERWNGSSWAVQPTKMPAGAGDTSFSAVSCTAAARCTAVGWSLGNETVRTLAERWDGKAWAVQPTPSAAGQGFTSLTAISCSSAVSCLAVGYVQPVRSGAAQPALPVAESWNGSMWTAQAIPDPPGSSGTFLTGISCQSAASCVATGYEEIKPFSGAPEPQALAWHWDGSTWVLVPAPAVSGGQSELNAVSCVSAVSCTAVGHYARGALAEHWDGSTWRQVQTTHPSGHNLLYGVSCLYPRSCTAVGAIRQPGIDASRKLTPLAEQE